jgi:Outer membrane cobalamin receptor protein
MKDNKLGFIDFQAGYQNRDFGANGFYSLKYPEQFEHTNTFLSSIRWVKKIGNNFTLNLISSYRRNHDRFELIKDNPSKVPYNYHLTDNLGEELWIDYKSKIGTISFGGDFTYNHIYSTVLGEKLQTAKGKYTKGKSREIGNIWARYKKNFNNFNISSSIGMSSTPYGQSAIWSISGDYNTYLDDKSYLKFDIGAAQSMRLPTFTDLYYTTTGYIGNPNLKPERAITYKLGTTYVSGKIQTSITGYYREGKDIIDWVKNSNEEDWESKQITTLNTFGVEFLSKYISNNGFLRMASLSYGYITTDKHSENKISKYALDYMRNKISCSVKMALHRNISLTAIGTLFDRSGKYTNQYGNIEAYKPYFLLDARIMYNIKFLSLYLDGTNLTSTKYFDYGGLEMPKIWASGGIIVTLK